MSDTINRLKIIDDVVNVNSKVNFGVLYSGANITSQEFRAVSANASSMVFNVVTPSI